MQAQDMRTVSALRAPEPAREAVERLSDRALRAAAANPDHSEAARRAIAEAMRARRISSGPWRVSVAGHIGAADLEKGTRLFFDWRRRARLAFRALAQLSAFALFAALAAASLGRVTDERTLWAIGAVLAAASAAWLTLSALRRKPARLLLVGAGAERASAAMARRELGVFGHVARMDAPEGPTIANAADYRALARRLRRRVRLNLATAVSPEEALPVRAAPHWRLLTLQLLANSCDAVIVDLTEGAAVLEDVREAAQDGRCVFVTLWGRIDAAEATLAAAGLDAPCFFYAPDGEMQRRGQFHAALIAAMRATHRVRA